MILVLMAFGLFAYSLRGSRFWVQGSRFLGLKVLGSRFRNSCLPISGFRLPFFSHSALPLFPLLFYPSIIPLLRYSIIPAVLFHYTIIPFFRYSGSSTIPVFLPFLSIIPVLALGFCGKGW